MTVHRATDLHFRLRPSRSRRLAGCGFALFMALSMRVDAACTPLDIDQAEADRHAYSVDDLRKRLETLTLSHSSRSPADALGGRLAWDETEQALSYYSTLKIVSGLHSRMSANADRSAVAAEFSRMADATAKSLQGTVQYLTIFSSKAADPSIAAEAARLRDELKRFAALFACADTARP